MVSSKEPNGRGARMSLIIDISRYPEKISDIMLEEIILFLRNKIPESLRNEETALGLWEPLLIRHFDVIKPDFMESDTSRIAVFFEIRVSETAKRQENKEKIAKDLTLMLRNYIPIHLGIIVQLTLVQGSTQRF